MARRAIDMGHPAAIADLVAGSNGIPPPSTIAAQIVNNHSRANEQQEPQDNRLFGMLLQEFLADPSAGEKDVKLNLQLISVVVEAGLNVLLKEREPLGQHVMLSQARDSISVIRISVERDPSLLFCQNPGAEEPILNLPLVAWLLPKLFSFLTCPSLEILQPYLTSLLASLLGALSRLSRKVPDSEAEFRDFWKEGLLLLEFYQATIDAVLDDLEHSMHNTLLKGSGKTLTLPPSSSILRLLPKEQQLPTLPRHCQVEIKSLHRVCIIALSLLAAISRYLSSSNSALAIAPARSVVYDWVIDRVRHFWELASHSTLLKQSNEHADRQIWLLFLGNLDMLLSKQLQEGKGATILYDILGDVTDHVCRFPPASAVQLELSNVLLQSLWQMRKEGDSVLPSGIELLFRDLVVVPLRLLAQDSSQLEALEKDLQRAIMLCGIESDETNAALRSATSPTQSDQTFQAFEDERLAQKFGTMLLSGAENEFPDNQRPRKRQRLDADSGGTSKSHWSKLVSNLYFGEEVSYELKGLRDTVMGHFESSSDQSKSRWLCHFMRLPCVAVGTFKARISSSGEFLNMSCSWCDSIDLKSDAEQPFWNASDRSSSSKEALGILRSIIEMPGFQSSKTPRVWAAAAIRSLHSHLNDSEALDLHNSSLGEWCMKSLRSSQRELRIAAGLAIPAFLRNNIKEEIHQRNRIDVLDYVKHVSSRATLGELETLVLAWGQIARACGEDELNIVLLQLVDLLGHTHPLICGVAYNELVSLCEHFKLTPLELLKPFWRNISFEVFKDLHSCPQKAQQLSDFLEMGIDKLLILIQTDLLPYLVLTKRRDILERVAAARKTNVQDVCVQPKANMASILTILFLHAADDVGTEDIESSAMDLLCESVPEFQTTDLQTLIKQDPTLIAFNLLKASAIEEAPKKERIHEVFRKYAVIAERSTRNTKANTRANPSKMIAEFFHNHILGIMAYFSDMIDNPKDPKPISERIKCLGALEEMISLAGSSVSVGLPQIRACLQSASEIPELCDKAFSAWSTLLDVVDDEDVEFLIDQTFSIVEQNWESFSPAGQAKAHDVVAGLVNGHKVAVQERVNMLPSFDSIPVMSKISAQINRFRAHSVDELCQAFSKRCRDESAIVVTQALKELIPFLEDNQQFIHDSTINQHPSPVVMDLCRSILDASTRFTESHPKVANLSAQCLGVFGALDPSRAETIRPRREILMMSNFTRLDESNEFVAFMLETVLAKSFHSATNAKSQAFIAYAMQECLKFCGLDQDVLSYRPRASQASPAHQLWIRMPESVRSTLTPFLSSKYSTDSVRPVNRLPQKYPIFSPDLGHSKWLKQFVYDMLLNGKGENPQIVFPVLAKIIRSHDVAIATFLLPFTVVNIALGGTEREIQNIIDEFLLILDSEITGPGPEADNIKRCSENVFQVLDYMSKWLQEKRKRLAEARVLVLRGHYPELDEITETAQISSIERVLSAIPAEVISRRAVECRSFARALFHWEQYMRQCTAMVDISAQNTDQQGLYQHLQYIYAQIDEPDCIEGISAHLQILDPEQQILEHKKAGRWTAVQSWYEMSLAEKPDDSEVQYQLATCLRESGQYNSMLAQVKEFQSTTTITNPKLLSLAAEASWMTGKWHALEELLSTAPAGLQEFNIGIGKAFLSLRDGDDERFSTTIGELREGIARGLSPASTASLQACHDQMLKLHVLYEIDSISRGTETSDGTRSDFLTSLDRRLDMLGALTSEKQYILGLRRAAMQLSRRAFTNLDVASTWVTTSRLARKTNVTSTAFDAVHHASRLGDDEAIIDHARLLWKEGHHRKAIQNLEGALNSNAFGAHDTWVRANKQSSHTTNDDGPELRQENKVAARAWLFKAKWIDSAGQTSFDKTRVCYTTAVRLFPKWEKGHYYLGKYYAKQSSAEMAQPEFRRSQAFRAGEYKRLVIENYLRSVAYGTKHLYETVPKLLTLWLELATEVQTDQPSQRTNDLQRILSQKRKEMLKKVEDHLDRYAIQRLPAFIFYTALPQMITRICHTRQATYELLARIIVKVVGEHPRQALWGLLAVVKSTNTSRSNRGMAVLTKVKEYKKSKHGASSGPDLKLLVSQGQKLSEALLHACDAQVEPRATRVSLSRDLGFNHKLAPCPLVVPVETTLVASLPTGSSYPDVQYKHHKAFQDIVPTISSFLDDVSVLPSLQRPRKLVVRGSDGRNYGLLIKPKDDLRKDQRLMEFNTMINRALLRDVESSKRRLNIKTYAVTPLNEECGAIEWVEGLKAMRDIIIKLYREKNIPIDYTATRVILDQAAGVPAKNGDPGKPEQLDMFTDLITQHFKPVLHEWFIETFPEPEAWFAARLKYTRSCAVMSIVGHTLGLGDRHGENVLLVEHDGGVFHVDFNCLFEKGLTFEKPELVPFRLTHNMVDAMGPYGVDGPFRTAAQLTLRQLQQSLDTLMTILETFLYDPTADFIGKKRKSVMGVPTTPEEVLESVSSKVRGYLKEETAQLSVEGCVDMLISAATDPKNLAKMYIGWCAFF
ncbi:hypothetical protein IWX90DRAFT_148777 [Phyllosticta citrichinensis]|uniref:non-specific serine/threonine protein kinase n=1 Tax=Phyllosticta citrichinensis TaxID=1130410 RepID=A0ABR1XZB0_9PEZI